MSKNNKNTTLIRIPISVPVIGQLSHVNTIQPMVLRVPSRVHKTSAPENEPSAHPVLRR